MTAFIQHDGWTLALLEAIPAAPRDVLVRGAEDLRPSSPTRGAAVRLGFVDASEHCRVAGDMPAAGRHHYLLGSDARSWRTNVPLFAGTRHHGVWKGVDITTYLKDGHLEYDVIVAPEADLGAVRVEVQGADHVRAALDGSLVIETSVGSLVQNRPVAWTEDEHHTRTPVACDFDLRGGTQFGFRTGPRNLAHRLVIDPGIVFATYVGGSADDYPWGAVSDAVGTVTLTGSSTSANFPISLGAFDPSHNGTGTDAFVTRLSADGSTLLYSTFFGGSSDDVGKAIALGVNGEVFVAGATASTDFPTTLGAYDTSFSGSLDAFVVRLNATGTAPVYSTLLGATNVVVATTLAVHGANLATISGYTLGTGFPTTPGVLSQTNQGSNDIFLTRLNATGSGLIFSTLLGGSGDDGALDIAVNALGQVTLTGFTTSATFPTTVGAYDSSHNGGYDAIALRVNATATAIVYSTFIGGSASDMGRAIALDAQGIATVTGTTASTGFPVTAGAFGTVHQGGTDVFVTRLNATGSSLAFSTLLGGGGSADTPTSIVVEPSGTTLIAGYTNSFQFPVTSNAFDNNYNGPYDAFLTRLNATASQLDYSTFFGGGGADGAESLAVDSAGTATIVGFSSAPNLPSTSGSFDPFYNGGNDAFVAQLTIGSPPFPFMLIPAAQQASSTRGAALTFVGPAATTCALFVDITSINTTLLPGLTLGVPFPPLIVLDGIGGLDALPGMNTVVPYPLTIPNSGQFTLVIGPLPPALIGMTLYAQSYGVHPGLFNGMALSSHGVLSAASPACQLMIVP